MTSSYPSAAFQLHGAYTALVTPFTESAEFDSHAYSRLLEFQVDQGIGGLVPCGTTGESPTITWEEQGSAIALAVRLAEGRASVLAGTGSNNTAEAIEGTRDAWSRGASAALLVDCYYNGPSSLELRTEYYERILEAVPELPIVPYIIPGRSGCALGAEDLALLHLGAPERVPAVKSATGDFSRMRRDRELAGDSLAIFSGDDEITLRMMSDPQIQACGVISVMSNLVPAAVSQLCRAQRAGDAERAAELNTKLSPLFGSVGVQAEGERQLPGGQKLAVSDHFRNPGPVKTMMAGLGMIRPIWRPPLGKMTPRGVAACREALRRVHVQAPELLQPIEQAFDVSIQRRLDSDAVWASVAR